MAELTIPDGEEQMVKVELGEWSDRIRSAVFYARAVCRSHGYALAVHGSLRRDVDVVAVPWADDASPPLVLAKEVHDCLVRLGRALGWGNKGDVPDLRAHGRQAFTIVLAGDPFCYVDLSIVAPTPRPSPTNAAIEAIELVAAERARQRAIEGWTEAHDDAHKDASLARVAALYATPASHRRKHAGIVIGWPRSWAARWWKPTPKDRVRELVKAGALIVAEIERLQRGGAA